MVESNCKCPVCGIDAFEEDVIHRFAKMYSCNRCGKFIIESDSYSFFSSNEPGPKIKASLFWYLRQIDNSGLRPKKIPLIFSSDWEEGIRDNYQFISIRSLLNLFPQNINEQINMILVNIAKEICFVGGELVIDWSNRIESYPLFFIDVNYIDNKSYKQLEEKIAILKENGLLKLIENHGDMKLGYTLTAKGWGIVQDLQSKKDIIPQAFIAMWFDSSMNIARDKIRKAISDCGYLPVVIDEKEYNSFIVPEIFYEIENSRFVVADFTGDRGGVYYEAGYAKGLKKEVIMTCKKEKFNPHFDTKQINFIIWENEDELYERLVKRIKATVGCTNR